MTFNVDEPITGNKRIEDAAIAWVMDCERAAGRTPQDTRYRRAPADIESPPRLIEVKAFGGSNRGYDLWLETRQVEARRNPHFFLYVVENMRQGKSEHFKLKVLDNPHLLQLLERAKMQQYYLVPWPTRDYDATNEGMN